MKTLRITDDVHQKLTALLGELTTQTMRMQTYTDAIEALLKESVVLPAELLTQIENFIKTQKQLGFMTKEEFIRDAARWRLRYLTGAYEYMEIHKDKYEKSDNAIKEMSLPYLGITDFIEKQLDSLIEKHAELQQEAEAQRTQKRRN